MESMNIMLFHSTYGLRPAVRAAADRLRAAGHEVWTPDLFEGHTFETVEELRQALLAFREIYNETWLIERHGFLSPAEYRRRHLQPHAQAA